MFRLGYRGAAVTLLVRDGFVEEELIALVDTGRPTAQQTARLDVLKREMAERVLAASAPEVYDAEAGSPA